MTICFITNKYPNVFEPNAIVFLQQLVAEISKHHTCIVICPIPTNLNKNYKKLPYCHEEEYGGSSVKVFFPRYLGLGQSNFGPFNPAKITTLTFSQAAEKVVSSLSSLPDVIYGHFVTPAGIAAARIGKKHHISSFLAYGEATMNTIHHYGEKATKKELATLAGVIAVSTQNRDMITPYVPNDIIEVFPNSIDSSVFYMRDKAFSRKQMGFDESKFIVAFVGSFDERKGINRLSNAIESISDDNICYICAGKGALQPTSAKCVFCDSVLHADLPTFLSAADVFVLPTLNEGCCNAIIEAMACGLPIISSDLPFNDDILDDTNSIRIDPQNTEEIANAILRIKNSPELAKTLSEGSLRKAKGLTLERRATNILNFIERKNNEK